jgi:hypothetical protein
VDLIHILPRDPGGVYRISRRTRISTTPRRNHRNRRAGRPRTPRRAGLGFCIWHPARLPDRRACIVPSRTEKNGAGWISHRPKARKDDDRLGISTVASAVIVPSWPIFGISYDCPASPHQTKRRLEAEVFIQRQRPCPYQSYCAEGVGSDSVSSRSL